MLHAFIEKFFNIKFVMEIVRFFSYLDTLLVLKETITWRNKMKVVCAIKLNKIIFFLLGIYIEDEVYIKNKENNNSIQLNESKQFNKFDRQSKIKILIYYYNINKTIKLYKFFCKRLKIIYKTTCFLNHKVTDIIIILIFFL